MLVDPEKLTPRERTKFVLSLIDDVIIQFDPDYEPKPFDIKPATP